MIEQGAAVAMSRPAAATHQIRRAATDAPSYSRKTTTLPALRPKHGVQVLAQMRHDAQGAGRETFVTQEAGKLVESARTVHVGVFDTQQDMANRAEMDDADRREIQSTLLLKKKKEMLEVQEGLERKRVEFTRRMEHLRVKQEELRVRHQQFRERVHKFEKFLKESDAKRQRANAKAVSERKMREHKEVELEQLAQQLVILTRRLERTQRRISKHRVYETYLQSVLRVMPPDQLDSSDPQISDLIQRIQTLRETSRDLVGTLQEHHDEIERQQALRSATVKEKNDRILVANAELSRLQKRLDQLKQQHAYHAMRVEEIEANGKAKARTLGAVNLAVENLFDRVGGRSQYLFVRPAAAEPEVPPGGPPVSQPAPTAGAPVAPQATAAASPATFATQNHGSALAPVSLAPPVRGASASHAPAATVVIPVDAAASGRGLSLAEKLATIQDKVLDVQTIANRLVASEKAQKRSTLAAQKAATAAAAATPAAKAAAEADPGATGAGAPRAADVPAEPKLRVVCIPIVVLDETANSAGSSAADLSASNAALSGHLSKSSKLQSGGNSMRSSMRSRMGPSDGFSSKMRK